MKEVILYANYHYIARRFQRRTGPVGTGCVGIGLPVRKPRGAGRSERALRDTGGEVHRGVGDAPSLVGAVAGEPSTLSDRSPGSYVRGGSRGESGLPRPPRPGALSWDTSCIEGSSDSAHGFSGGKGALPKGTQRGRRPTVHRAG